MALLKPINEWNLLAWFREPWFRGWQATTAMGKMPLTDGPALGTCQKISKRINMESWADFFPSPNNSLCRAIHLLLGKPNYLGICLQQPPATLDWRSKAESRFIHEITCQTWVLSRRFYGKAVRQSVEQLPWTKRQPVPDLWPYTVSLQKQIPNLEDKKLKEINSWAGHNHKLNKDKRTNSTDQSVLSLGISPSQLLLNLAGPTATGWPIPMDCSNYEGQSKYSGSKWPV